MVRGLSYYTGPIWELVAPGVSGSIGSGGRYDHLIEALGGPDVPGTGASIGVERILAMLPGADTRSRLDVAVTVMGSEFAGPGVRPGGDGAGGRPAGERLPRRLGQARPAAEVGR